MKSLFISLGLSILCAHLVSAAQPEAQTDKESAFFDRWWQVGVPGHPAPPTNRKGPVKKVLGGEVTISDKFGNWMEKKQAPWQFVTFNVQGEVSESILFFWVVPTHPHPCHHDVYTYDARGHQIQTLWYSVEGQTPVQLCDNAKGVLTEQGCYDTQGRPLSIEEVCRRSETLLYQTAYKYDAQGNVIESTQYKGDGTLNWKTVDTYDEKGKRISEAHYGADGSMQLKEFWSHDTEGKLILARSYKGDGSPAGQTLYTYDERGNRIEKVTKYTDESPEERYVYSYDEAGRGRQQTGYKSGSLVFQETYDVAGNRMKSVEAGTTTTYSYTDKGELIEEAAYALDGTLTRRETLRYEYDPMGNVTKVIHFRRVTKFGESYFEPYRGEYWIITYYGKEEQ